MFHDESVLLQAAVINTAHEMHEGAEVGPFAALFPALLLAIIICRHFPEERIAVIGDNMALVIVVKGFEPVFQLIAQGLVLDNERVDTRYVQAPALRVIVKAEGFMVLQFTIGRICRGSDEVIHEEFSKFLPAVLHIGFNGNGFQLGGFFAEVQVQYKGKTAAAEFPEKGFVADGGDDELVSSVGNSCQHKTAVGFGDGAFGASIKEYAGSDERFT